MARLELGTLENLARDSLAVPKVRSIISNMGGSMKSRKKSSLSLKMSEDLMKSKIVDAREVIKETEVKLEHELFRMKNVLGMNDRMITRLS